MKIRAEGLIRKTLVRARVHKVHTPFPPNHNYIKYQEQANMKSKRDPEISCVMLQAAIPALYTRKTI